MSPRGSALRLWAEDQNPGFIALIATANQACDALLSGPGSMRASTDQLGAMAAAAQRRLVSEPCPDPGLADRLASLIEQYGLVARSFEAADGEYRGDIHALGRQLRVLISEFAVFMADLGHAIEGH